MAPEDGQEFGDVALMRTSFGWLGCLLEFVELLES